MIQYVIGGMMVVFGIFASIFFPRRIKNRNIEIKFLQTTPISELKGILTDNAKAGLEGYRHYVEIKGVAASDTVQKAPFSGKNVAYFDASLYQVYEETETMKDSSGISQQRIKKNEVLLSNNKSTDPVVIKETQSGEKVYCDIGQSGLQFDTLKTLEKFEPAGNIRQYSFFKNFTYSPMGSRTLGFRMVENTVPLGQALYAVGEAWLDGIRIYLGRPRDEKNPFILSVRSESDIIRGNKTGANVVMVLGILLALAGVLVMIFVR